MQKIKILHIIKSLGRGGAEMLLPETLKLHDKGIFEFHYIYFLPWKDQMVEYIRKAGGRITCFNSSNNIQLLRKAPKVTEYCKNNGIDIIHCHLPWSGFLGRIVHKQTNIPLIYTEHNIQERYHFATKLLNKISFNYQTMALGVSKDVSKSIEKNINPNIPVVTLLNGVNTDYFSRNLEKGNNIREKYNIPLDAVVIGNIAVFREQKDIPTWLKSFRKILKQDPDIYGLLVGAGPEEEKIKNMIKEFKLQDKVILPGLQTDTISHFSAMDIFMMSSQFEGLPIALLEAMSTGCAIVSTNAGGVVEVITNGKDGLLGDTGNWKDLANNVQKLLIDDLKLGEFKRAARTRVEENFSLQKMVLELEENYLQVLKIQETV